MKFRVFCNVAPRSLADHALMMEAVHTSETSVNFNVTTRRYIPEDPKLYYNKFLTSGCPVSRTGYIDTDTVRLSNLKVYLEMPYHCNHEVM
jgi:hypothetical protein